MQIVVFKIGKEEYGFEIQKVQEIVKLEKTTKIPNAPQYIQGIINLREKIIPVLDLAMKFCLEGKAESETTRMIVLNMGESMQLAIKADEVTEVLTIEESDVEKAPEIIADNKESCLKGIAKVKDKLIMLLDSTKIIEVSEIGLIEGIK